MKQTRKGLGKSFFKQQISETKRVLKKSKYPPYRKELKKGLDFWENELKKFLRVKK